MTERGRVHLPLTLEPLTMEYVVTMTTHVPDGTAEQAVADVRPARRPTRASSPGRGICSGCGARRRVKRRARADAVGDCLVIPL